MNKRIRKKKRTTQKYVRHKEFMAAQSAYNNHVMIFHDGRMVAHVPCDRRLKRGELRGLIDRHIYIANHLHEFCRKANFEASDFVKRVCETFS